METSREAMTLAKNVRCNREWINNVGKQIMRKVTQLKFEQVDEFKNMILAYKDKQFVEASWNNTWGIGVPFSQDMDINPQAWRGENLFGDILTSLAGDAE